MGFTQHLFTSLSLHFILSSNHIIEVHIQVKWATSKAYKAFWGQWIWTESDVAPAQVLYRLFLMHILGTFGYNQHTVLFVFFSFNYLPESAVSEVSIEYISVLYTGHLTMMPHSVYIFQVTMLGSQAVASCVCTALTATTWRSTPLTKAGCRWQLLLSRR